MDDKWIILIYLYLTYFGSVLILTSSHLLCYSTKMLLQQLGHYYLYQDEIADLYSPYRKMLSFLRVAANVSSALKLVK